MALTYLFFQPARLPLETGDLDAGAVTNLQDPPGLRATLQQVLPGATWPSPHLGQATVDGNAYEFTLPESPDETLSIRCSLRADPTAFVQDVCNRTGWVAFDEQPMCFQPHRDPMPA